MIIIQPSIEIMSDVDGNKILRTIEEYGRVCYKSEKRITADSAKEFVSHLIQRGHESVLEHVSLSVRIICDRGVSHEIVRHRIASYSQESTRYCNYAGKDIEFVSPFGDKGWGEDVSFHVWSECVRYSEQCYNSLINQGCNPGIARSVLPNSLKTELIMTCNLREWRHFLRLRTGKAAHYQMRHVAGMILDKFKSKIPVIFDDI